MTVVGPSRIKEIFTEAQYSVAAHKNLLRQLKKLHQSLAEDVFLKTFTDCLKVPLMCGEKTSPTERTLDFATSFITSFITKKERLEGENTNEEDEEGDEMPKFVTDIFTFMCENAGAANQIIRFRICQFINKLLNGLGNDACMDDDLCDLLCDRLMERLKDKSALVRTQAVRALYRLQDPTDVNCRVTSAFNFHLSSDPSADVRATVLTNIAISASSVRGIFERTRDTNETVRKVAFVRIAELNIQRFSIEARVCLLERGLKDQSEKVRKSVDNDLLRSWLDFHKGNFVAYLHALDCEHATETSALSLEAMFKSSKTGLTNAIEQIGALQGSDKLLPVEELTPENVLLWKVVNEYLEKHPEIAEERPIDEPLEDLVPELSTFCSYITKYFEQPPSGSEPWVHAQREYILGRLLEMTEGFDLADEMGRMNLRSVCQSLLLNNGVSDRVVPLLVKIMVRAIPNLDDRLQCLAEVIAELHDPSTETEEPARQTSPQMSAEEKRQLEIKEAKIKMKLNELTEDQDEAVKAKDFIRAQQLQDECQKLRDELKALTAPPPPVETRAPSEARPEELIIKDKSKLQKCLCIVKEMMQSSSVVFLTPTLRSLMHNFVMPCLSQANDTVIKNMALEAMGLFCLLDRDLAKQHFVYMFCFQIANDELCETALKVTFDLLHLYGLETFEVEQNKADDDGGKKRFKKKKNLFVTDTLDDEFEEDEDDTQSQTLNTSRANTANLIGMLTSLLGSTSTTMRNLAMKGLCKLLLACRMTSSALLSRLIVMWYSPVTDGDQDFRQPMAAFLKALSGFCPRGQEMLEEAFLPTLKILRDAPGDSPLSEVDTESVIKLFITLTRPGTNRFHKKQNTHVHNAIAVTLCNEILNQEDSYLDDNTFLRCLLELELCLDDPVFRQDLRKFINSMKEVFRMRKEKLLYKYVERFEKMVEQPGSGAQIACPEVDNTAQTDQLNGVDNTARTDQLNGVDNTARTEQLTVNSIRSPVVKKSVKNAKLLKRGEDSSDSDDGNVSDTSTHFDGSHLSQGTIIPESPRPESPGAAGIDSQDEVEVNQRDPKRRKVVTKKTASSPKKTVASPEKTSETPSKSSNVTRKGRRRMSNEEISPSRSSSRKTATEPVEATKETGGRRGARAVARTAEQVKEIAKTGRRAARKDSDQDEEITSRETQERESRRKRKTVELDTDPTKKKATATLANEGKESPAKSKKASEDERKKTVKVVEVVLDTMEVSDGRPRREVKLTARALAYKEDLSKRSPTKERSSVQSPRTPTSAARSQSPRKTNNANADISPSRAVRKGSGSATEHQSSSSPSPMLKRTRRFVGTLVDQKGKPKQKGTTTKDTSSSDDMFSKTPPSSRTPQRATPVVLTSRRSSPLKTPSPAPVRKRNTRNAKNHEGNAEPKTQTRSGSFSVDSSKKLVRSLSSASPSTLGTNSKTERALRSKTRPEEENASPAARRVKGVSAQEEKLRRGAKTTSSKPSAVALSSSSETSSPERRPKARTQQSSSSTDSPLPASSSSDNAKIATVKLRSEKPMVQPTSSEDSSEPEAVGRVIRVRRSGIGVSKLTTPSKDSPGKRSSHLSSRDEVIQRAVDSVKRSGVLSASNSSSIDTPATRSSRSSSQEDIIQRALDRVRRSEIVTRESSSSSNPTPMKTFSPLSGSSSDSPAKSTRSGSSQEETDKRTLNRPTSKESPAPSTKKTTAATPQKTPGRPDKSSTPADQAKSNSDSSSSSKTSTLTNSTGKPKAKTSLGRLSAGGIPSPTMSTRSQDLVNKLRSRKRV